ncbi:MAG: CoA transferase, partial [Alphaproteobacteria bacterium]|nr:CoA transferase [Alphaproteobacteria bacterium]
MSASPSGPLVGLRVIELAGIGPGPFAAMMLSDLGADVLRVDRTEPSGLGVPRPDRFDLLRRGRRSAALDLKRPEGVTALRRLARAADIVIDPFRPGVLERLGIGPDVLLADNPGLVVGRMTGWGQDGPLADTAGHDIDYIAIVGALHPMGEPDGRPVPPLNLIGDFGGGAMFLVAGVLAALLSRGRTGRGQVVDAAMTDGAAYLMTMFYGMQADGSWQDRRGANALDGAAPFYGTYETADGKWIAIGPIEAKFWSEFLARAGLAPTAMAPQWERAKWDEGRRRLAAHFRTRTREEWVAAFEGSDACVAPVLSLAEAPAHPHNRARRTFVAADGVTQPAPAPRFSAT